MTTARKRLILSPCGTSLLTNGCDNEVRSLLNRHTNSKVIEVEADRVKLESRVLEVQASLKNADSKAAQRLSAELNGILTLYSSEPNLGQDHHILLCTDTWLGEQTAQLVEGWLRSNGHTSVELRRQHDLQTRDLNLFQSALSDLVGWLEGEIDTYRQQKYHIVFNLTGGFKSVQGFLQTLGNLYADETIYIFESANALLRIPRLPVRMDAMDTVRRHERTIRRLANNLTVSARELEGVPDTFLLRLDDGVSLSPWGGIVWNQSRTALYSERVWPAPSDRIRFAKTFEASIQNLSGDRLYNLNDKLDKLAVYLEGTDRRPLKSLDLKALVGNPKPPSTHEFDAWADGDAKRVFCHYEGNVLVLDRLDRALH